MSPPGPVFEYVSPPAVLSRQLAGIAPRTLASAADELELELELPLAPKVPGK